MDTHKEVEDKMSATESIQHVYIWNRKSVLKLVKLFEERPVLYKRKNRQFKNHGAQYKALMEIVAYFRRIIFPGITLHQIQNELNKLCHKYKTELHLQTLHKRMGTPPTVSPYWYRPLKFLKPHVKRYYHPLNIKEHSTLNQANSSFLAEDINSSLLDSQKSETKLILPTFKIEMPDEQPNLNTNTNYKEFDDLEFFAELIKGEIRTIVNPIKQIDLKREIIDLIIKFKKDLQ